MLDALLYIPEGLRTDHLGISCDHLKQKLPGLLVALFGLLLKHQRFILITKYNKESMWSPGGVQHRESLGITGTPCGLHQDSTRTPGTFWLCPRHLKMYLESWWSPGSPQESTWNAWGSVKTSFEHKLFRHLLQTQEGYVSHFSET